MVSRLRGKDEKMKRPCNIRATHCDEEVFQRMGNPSQPTCKTPPPPPPRSTFLLTLAILTSLAVAAAGLASILNGWDPRLHINIRELERTPTTTPAQCDSALQHQFTGQKAATNTHQFNELVNYFRAKRPNC